jgi:hypothetical protein
MDDITAALLNGEDMEVGADRALLRSAVMRAITDPYSGALLDVRRAVLLDGSDHGGRMDIMTAEVYDVVLAKAGGLEPLKIKLGYELDVYDGRELFA